MTISGTRLKKTPSNVTAGLTAASSLLGLAFSGDDAACVSDIKEEYSDPLWPSGKALGW